MPLILPLIYMFIRLIVLALDIYQIIIIISVVLSWVGAEPFNPIVRFVRGITEPVFRRVRSAIPTTVGMIDFSPMIVLVGIWLLRHLIVSTISGGLYYRA